ncbi:MAG: hypothetical protein LUG24_03945 [Clostridiales bacterium]|nr:hypothetical protein [Clostridiales bacterium]
MSDEIASIIRFILELTGDGITPYYDRAPADFTGYSIYFPQSEFTAKNKKIEKLWL